MQLIYIAEKYQKRGGSVHLGVDFFVILHCAGRLHITAPRFGVLRLLKQL